MPRVRKVFVAGIVLCAVACSARPEVKHARQGDFGALGHDLDERAQKGDLDDGDVRAVARAILEHDLERFSGDQGVSRTLALEACAKEIASPLSKRAKEGDDVAAASAWVVVSAGLERADYYDDHVDDPRPYFRAAATRGLFDESEAKKRAARAIDDDEHVRRAAVLAAGDAGCATDFPVLLDSARKDPSLIVRVDAVMSLAKIAGRLSTDTARGELVDRLRELWTDGDDALRGAIARAWASKELLDVGGRRELESAMGREEGHATVDAASALMRAGGDGETVLARQAKDADAAVRAHAIRLLDPKRETHEKALVAILDDKDDDPSLRVIAASALLSTSHRTKAVELLVSFLSRQDKVGSEAAFALADEKDARAMPRLVADLKTPSGLRFRVASALVRLGKPGETRTLLSSGDVDVRDGTACAILSTPKP